MSDVFPKWTNQLPLKLVAGVLLLGGSAVAGIWYYFTPAYTRVGYQPIQPVSFSHNIHVEQLGLDCRYCHDGVEKSWYSNIPASSVCMNCHNQVLKDDPKLALVRESAASGRPIPWVQVHKVPDYVYFNHAVHVNRGVSCVHCHGQLNQMDEVYHAKPLGMTFCLECHRHPEAYLRAPAEVYNLEWQPENQTQQLADGARYVKEWNVKRLEHCSACHR
ncbi:MAG: cytochrome c3 family protein [Verrucomicrobia bacterium]|nr:cytochrome c3 family protein [Verrucomicrobiota bacterium]